MLTVRKERLSQGGVRRARDDDPPTCRRMGRKAPPLATGEHCSSVRALSRRFPPIGVDILFYGALPGSLQGPSRGSWGKVARPGIKIARSAWAAIPLGRGHDPNSVTLWHRRRDRSVKLCSGPFCARGGPIGAGDQRPGCRGHRSLGRHHRWRRLWSFCYGARSRRKPAPGEPAGRQLRRRADRRGMRRRTCAPWPSSVGEVGAG